MQAANPSASKNSFLVIVCSLLLWVYYTTVLEVGKPFAKYLLGVYPMYTFVHRPGAVCRLVFSDCYMHPPTRGLYEKISKTPKVPQLTHNRTKPTQIHPTYPIHPHPTKISHLPTLAHRDIITQKGSTP